MKRASNKYWLPENWLRVIVHLGVWGPLGWLVWHAWINDLGVDPIVTLYNVLGRTALILLLLCLSATPLYILFGFRAGLTVRRALGLYAFLYAALHFTNFVALDYMFDVQYILDDGIQTKPYILVGLGALLILVALAVTSTKGWMKRLKRNWTRLHWLIYPTALLVVLHFYWSAKAAVKWEPLLYAAVLGVILLVRVPPIRKAIVNFRQRRKRAAPTRAVVSSTERAALIAPTQPGE
jgi:sulfoxide reductase heme-binding subunit YedZ